MLKHVCGSCSWEKQLSPKLPAVRSVGPCDPGFVAHVWITPGVFCPPPLIEYGWLLLKRSDAGLSLDSLAARPEKLPPAEVHFIHTIWPIFWVRLLHPQPPNFRKTQWASPERCRNNGGKLHYVCIDCWGIFLAPEGADSQGEEDCCWMVSVPFQSHIPAFGLLCYFFSLARSSPLVPRLTTLLDFQLLHVLFSVLMGIRACTVN